MKEVRERIGGSEDYIETGNDRVQWEDLLNTIQEQETYGAHTSNYELVTFVSGKQRISR